MVTRDERARLRVAVFGGGPAGLMAADVLADAGAGVTVYERMPSFGRKLLMAGRGGLNLTHGEDIERLLPRYGAARPWLEPHVRAFPPDMLRAFVEALGQETFVGSSGRIFPKAMKASPMLRAWLRRLAALGVAFEPRSEWRGITGEGRHRIGSRDGMERQLEVDAAVLAFGGGSWPRLGSDGRWVSHIEACGIGVAPLVAANAGVRVAWSEPLRSRFAGTPLKRIAVRVGDELARGEAVITAEGLEGGAIYALCPAIRALLAQGGTARLEIDLRPDLSEAAIAEKISRPLHKLSTSTWLHRTLNLAPVAIALLREVGRGQVPADRAVLAKLVKAVPVDVLAIAGLDRAISTAGGIPASEVDDALMLRRRPGVFVAGEMLDWEAPTGGYLLQACFATGRAAGEGALRYLTSRDVSARE